MDVHPHHVQTRHAFDGLPDILLHVVADLLDRLAVFNDNIEVKRSFLAADLHLDTPGGIAVAADDVAQASADAHPGDPFDFIGSNARNGGNHLGRIGYGTAVLQIHVHIGGQVVFFLCHSDAPPVKGSLCQYTSFLLFWQ